MAWMQSASSRWLAGIASFAAVLIIVSVLVSVLANDDDLLPADTPEGAVQRYLRAVGDDDIVASYEYVSEDLKDECTLEHFLQMTRFREQNFSAALSQTTDIGDKTVVSVEITEQGNDGPFGSGQYSFDTSFTLVLENGEWRMSEPPWPVSFCPPERELPTRPAIPPATAEAATSTPLTSAAASTHGSQDEGWRPLWSS